MNIQQVVLLPISFQSQANSPSIEKEVSIGEIIKEIKYGKYAKEIEGLRKTLAAGDIKKYTNDKKYLAGVTFSATFEGSRKKDNLKNYNSIIVIDIDKLSPSQIQPVKDDLNACPYVFTFWLSPSMNGYKGLVYIQYPDSVPQNEKHIYHKKAFLTLTQYFQKEFNIELDNSGSDIPRLCFLSYDKDLVFKDDIIPFPIPDAPIPENIEKPSLSNEYIKKVASQTTKIYQYKGNKDLLNNPQDRNNQFEKQQIIRIMKFLTRENKSITETYDKWYRVAYAIANSFTHNIGEKYFLQLCRLDGVNHDEQASKNMLLYCYEKSNNSIKFNTIQYFATEKGFKI
jgi:hypothetical protein